MSTAVMENTRVAEQPRMQQARIPFRTVVTDP